MMYTELSNLHYKLMMSRHLDCCLDIKMSQYQFSILFNQQFLAKHRIVVYWSILSIYDTLLFETIFSLLHRKFISAIRFEDVKDIKRNTITQLHNISKEEFWDASTNGKLTGINVLNSKRIVLKKIYILFFVYFCRSKYSIALDTFWTYNVYTWGDSWLVGFYGISTSWGDMLSIMVMDIGNGNSNQSPNLGFRNVFFSFFHHLCESYSFFIFFRIKWQHIQILNPQKKFRSHPP